MKKHLAINHNILTGSTGLKDFNNAEDAEAHLDKIKASTKIVISSEDDLIEMLRKTSEPVLRRTLALALADYNPPAQPKKKEIPVLEPPKMKIHPVNLNAPARVEMEPVSNRASSTPGRETDKPDNSERPARSKNKKKGKAKKKGKRK